MEVKQIQIADITVGERLRNTSPATVAELRVSFRDEGQLTPVIVRRHGHGWRLLAGAHRLEAAKSLGWGSIAAIIRPVPHWADPTWTEVDDVVVETEENMRRKNLDYAESAIFATARVRVEERRIAWMEGKRAEAEQEYAEHLREIERQREAAAKKAVEEAKAREDAEALKKAEAELKAATEAREAAQRKKRTADYLASKRTSRHGVDKTEPSGSDWSTPVTDRRPGEHGIGLAVQRVAADVGRTALSLHKNFLDIQRMGGEAVAKEFAGTTLGTKAEITAMGRLRKEFPEEAEALYISAKNGRNVSARATLGQLLRDKNADARQATLQSAAGDRQKAALLALPIFGRFTGPIADLASALQVGGLADDHKELMGIASRLTEMKARLSQYRSVASAKPDGTEHKYVGVSPAQSKARAQAKADQEANAKVPAEALKKAPKKHAAAATLKTARPVH